jgi:hypothetical protein
MASKVFITQLVQRFDPGTKLMVPAFDFSAAAQFGELTPILTPDDDPKYIARITDKINSALESFTENDYLLAVGDPSVIAVCAGIILRKQPTMKLLKWDRQLKIYIQLEINP